MQNMLVVMAFMVTIQSLALQHKDTGWPALQRTIEKVGWPYGYGRHWPPPSHQKGFLFSNLTGLLWQKSVKKTHNGPRDLVLMHVPYNFGHTVEKVAMFPKRTGLIGAGMYLNSLGIVGGRKASWPEVRMLSKSEAEIWGHFNPDLQEYSKVTGCQLYYTPQKYWPQHTLEKYFGNKTIFGMLRDPYERLVAFFRGNMKDYGGEYPEFFKKCDVNGAVKKMMKDHIRNGDKFEKSCTFIPQAEYFDGPYGIKVPVDNRKFPASANKLLLEHGYEDMQIGGRDIFHVSGCPHVWSGDLDAETKLLVQQVYARDFELLCKHFGYCDKNEDTCISQVPEMCPKHIVGMMSQKNGPMLEESEMHYLNSLRPGGV